MDLKSSRTLGANLQPDGSCHFKVWAPFFEYLELEIIPYKGNSYRIPLQKDHKGYFQTRLKGIKEKDCYYFCTADNKYPDLAANYQPQGIYGPSEIVAKSPPEKWSGRSLSSYIIYELHVGTYTPQGTFTAIIEHLPELVTLGITAIELMPVAQFSGSRNWGYDGVFPFAVQNSYGGPAGLKELINACHKHKIAVILDVVYNHIGPEGNFFEKFAPYFTNKYQTPWGKSLNFDDAFSHEVRNYFIENASHWFIEYGIDALRLDALHAIVDNSAYPFLEELADRIAYLSKEANREYYLIAESSANNPRLIRLKEQFGFGLHAQWNDEFHHALHSILTKELNSYYEDFGDINLFLKAYAEGYAYSGQYSKFRKQPHGVSSKALPAKSFVVFMQNHDHIGNRPFGDRLTKTLSPIQLKFYAALLFFSPYIPLIFMGEEYGETAPFQYFINHQNSDLIQAVREGRKQEFSFTHLEKELPDPQSESTFAQCKLNHSLKKKKSHQQILEFYKKLISIRKTHRALSHLDKTQMKLTLQNEILLITRGDELQKLLLMANFSERSVCYSNIIDRNKWELILSSYNEEGTKEELLSFGILIFKRIIKNE